MNQDRIEQAAAVLNEAHRTGTPLRGLPEGCAPQTQEEAWAIQIAVLALQGGTIGGYKAATPPGQAPFGAIMPASGLRASPAALALPAGGAIGIEAEIAFRILRDIPPGAPRETVLGSVVALPAIELVSTRFAPDADAPHLTRIADYYSNGGFVAGTEAAGWRSLDLSDLPVRLTIGETVVADKRGGNPAGDPLLPLLWLVDYLPTVGLALRAGQMVTTGSCTGLAPAAAGQPVLARFEGLGEVTLTA